MNIRINLLPHESRVFGLHFLSLIIWAIFFRFPFWAPKDARLA